MNKKTSYVIVTGGSGGIGDAICRRLSQDGYKVLNLDVQEPENPDASEFFEVDLFDVEKTRKTLESIVAKYPVTRLVNNVGIVRPASVADCSLTDFDDVMAINVKTTVICTQALLPVMRQNQFGRIVTISSRAALGKPLRTNYSASKAALIGISKTMALELANQGITVNVVAPGSIATKEFYRNNHPDSPQTKKILKNIPVGHIGTPEDVAHAAAFLLDDKSGYITGQVLYTCGGLTVGLSHG